MRKGIVSLITCFTLIIASVSLSFAQSISGYKQDSKTGWAASAEADWYMHIGSTASITYKFMDADIKNKYLTTFNSAKNMWSGTATFTESSNSLSTVNEYYDSTSSYTAKTTSTGTYDGHITKFKMEMNRYNYDKLSSATQQRTLAHELGHTLGLNDVYASSLSGNIMYYSSSSTKSVTDKDKTGARFVQHVHTMHVNFTYEPLDRPTHACRCGACGAYYVQAHTFVNGVCSKCGYRQ